MVNYPKNEVVPVKELMRLDNGKTYMAIETPMDYAHEDCHACAFGNKSEEFCRPIKCMRLDRHDRKNVVFIRYRPEIKDAALIKNVSKK